ncbi:hypothetical protein APA_1320 [Pseudanabaena sp. lw0831]|uniref:hypothetical protein n=1 Tax=Pseudanabaena sp. lw0831 TaxID=1357935 RepID=UPI00191657F7|nr:hypothetical protein [Pseudanabaena sp. lw0831]GBO53413.1 hypothetical protein APA_1320 [Pseudanabaena sp. lw0831]
MAIFTSAAASNPPQSAPVCPPEMIKVTISFINCFGTIYCDLPQTKSNNRYNLGNFPLEHNAIAIVNFCDEKTKASTPIFI